MKYPKPGKKKKQGRFTGGIEKKAWNEFAYWIKLSRSNDNGYVKCSTCPNIVNWAGSNSFLHAGHYFSWGNYPQLRFFENNVWPQCKTCNYYPEKSRGNFGLFIAKTLTKDEILKLEWLSMPKFKKNPTKIELELIYEKYKALNKELKASKMF